VVDLFAELGKRVSVEDVHTAIKSAAESNRMKGILEFMESPVVSSDVIGNSHSSIFDPAFTGVTGGKYLKCLSWYDNEWGYSNRVCDLLGLIRRWG
jgi:glyceraldehyde 3-phosphate dehydrogenase